MSICLSIIQQGKETSMGKECNENLQGFNSGVHIYTMRHFVPPFRLALCVCVLLYLGDTSQAEARCALFDVQDKIVEENSTVIMNFKLRKVNCPQDSLQNFEISVTKTVKNAHKTVCVIVHDNGVCVPPINPTDLCGCGNTTDTYFLRKRFDRSDSSIWGFWTDEAMAEKKNITISVLYPAEVTGLVLTPQDSVQTFENGTNVTAVCFWRNGHPPVQAFLLDRSGKKLEGSKENLQIRHIFRSVRCEDSGTIRCEAPGAPHNKTVTLLVKCPPKVSMPKEDIIVAEGRSTEIPVVIRSHTSDFTECTVTKISDIYSTSEQHRCNIIRVTGSRPNLTLTFRLDNVRKEDEGRWQLKLANEVGKGQADFTIEVADNVNKDWTGSPTITDNHETSASSPFLSTNFIVILSIGAGVLVIIVIAVTVAVVVVRRNRNVTVLSERVPSVDPFRNIDSVSKWSFSSDESPKDNDDNADKVSMVTFTKSMYRKNSTLDRRGTPRKTGSGVGDTRSEASFAHISPRSTKISEPFE